MAAAPIAIGGCGITVVPPDDDSSGGDSRSSAGGDSGTTGSSTTDGATDDLGTTSPASTGADTEGPSAACTDYAATVALCEEDPDLYEVILSYCVEYLGDLYAVYGEDCVSAYEDHFACLSALDCTSLSDDVGCEATEAAATVACGAGTS